MSRHAGVRKAIASCVRLGWAGALAGPLFEKELRVSSRRRRTYLLRFAYLVVLTAYAVAEWTAQVRTLTGGGLVVASRMADAGLSIVRSIVWFQFMTLPVIAAVMVSMSLREEIRRRTLDGLMAAPISHFHIVLGKLLSVVLQLGLLVGVSLPLLMAVRVFGGVPWAFVAAGLATTLLACLFYGAVSLFFSTVFERASAVVVVTLLATSCLSLPQWAMAMGSVDPTRQGGLVVSWVGWAFGAGITGGVTFALLRESARRLPRAAMTRPRNWVLEFLRRAPPRLASAQVGFRRALGPVRRVQGSPVLWRESGARLFTNPVHTGYAAALVLGLLGIWEGALYLGGPRHGPGDSGAILGSVLMEAAVLGTAVMASQGIAFEKEAGTLPVLLATPLTRRHIVLAKGAGALRRTFALWLPLWLHVGLMVVFGVAAPAVWPMVVLASLGAMAFLIGLGLLAGAWCRRVVTAGLVTAGVGLVLFVLLPMALGLVSDIVLAPRALGEMYRLVNPVGQVALMLEAAWENHVPGTLLGLQGAAVTLTALVYGLGGALCAWLAAARLRRGIV